jgi:flagella basal body P-ring formation protein FlgA
MMILAALTMAGCLAVGAGTDRVVGRDLAPLWPEGAEAFPAAWIAPAPAPGMRRFFPRSELLRLAARWNVAAPAGGLCVERPAATLEPARLLEAMRRAMPEAHIEILGFSRQPAPAGELEFSRTGLRQTLAGEFWGGLVRYAGTRTFPVWAKVRVRVEAVRVIAAQDLRPGIVIRAGQVRLETSAEFPGGGAFATSTEDVVGKLGRRAVAAGKPILKAWLTAAPDISRGDSVRVEVSAGGARLALEAGAETSGFAGQTIAFRNPATGRRFYARVEGRGRATVKAH